MLTPEKVVNERLKEASRRRGEPFRATVNEVLRCGFASDDTPRRNEAVITVTETGFWLVVAKSLDAA